MRCSYLGIDPGVNGGLCLLTPFRTLLSEMPADEATLWDWFIAARGLSGGESDSPPPIRACLERVGGFMGAEAGEKGGGPNKAAAHIMFTFGASYGTLRMGLAALGLVEGLTYFTAHPKTWQKHYGLKRSRNETKPQWKGRLHSTAQKLFPAERLTRKTCDAALLALYCKRHYEGA